MKLNSFGHKLRRQCAKLAEVEYLLRKLEEENAHKIDLHSSQARNNNMAAVRLQSTKNRKCCSTQFNTLYKMSYGNRKTRYREMHRFAFVLFVAAQMKFLFRTKKATKGNLTYIMPAEHPSAWLTL